MDSPTMMHRSPAFRSVFNEDRFRRQVDAALATVKTILETIRNPRYAADEEDHTYDDKYGLAEFLTNAALAAQMNVLEGLGMDAGKLGDLRRVSLEDKRSVTLRFEAEVTCDFSEERVVNVEGKREYATEETKAKGGADPKETTTTVRHKVITKVTEYHWRVGLQYAVYCFAGADPEANAVVLQRRSSSAEMITTGNKESPLPSKARSAPVDAPLNWLLDNISAESLTCAFKIDRSAESCRTPRRNEDIAKALAFFDCIRKWSDEVRQCLVRDIEGNIFTGLHADREAPSAKLESKVYLHAITEEGLFVPILPLFERPGPSETAAVAVSDVSVASPGLESRQYNASSPLLSIADINQFLKEQRRSLDEKVTKMVQFFPSKDSQVMISAAEAIIVLLSLHTGSIANQLLDGVDCIEDMLRNQLVRAIGKEVQASDFAEFVRFHDQKLLKEPYAPKPFCYAIRRPGHYPDGVLSIERHDGSHSDPIMTVTRKLGGAAMPPMFFPINAATSVEFTGDRYVHAWISHRFAGGADGPFHLVARARQFSSFLLLVGKISGPDSFEPQDAIILQNKDEVLVPLLLDQLPTPKEFKDAVASLSPEQRRFAEAFRNMQLESSVFAVCCVQLRPQLEALLGLPADALTKEIGLTRDLLSLFIEYQIPSDLLSFDGSPDMSPPEKVGVVKGHVASVLKVIESAKDKDLEAAQKEADMAFEQQQQRRSYPSRASLTSSEEGKPDESELALRCDEDIEQESEEPRPSGDSSLYSEELSTFPDLGIAPRRQDSFIQDSFSNRGGGGGGCAASFRPSPQAGMMMTRASGAPAHAKRSMAKGVAPPRAVPAAALAQAICSVALSEVPANSPPPQSPAQRSEMPSKTSDGKQAQPTFPDWGRGGKMAATAEDSGTADLTRIPKALDAKFDELDDENALRATVIKTGDRWTKKSQQNLLTGLEEKVLGTKQRKSERDKAFDLLDALSRSGSLPVDRAELHVVVAATHNFDNSLMETVIQDNVNPIEKMEKSTLIVASTIHGVHPVRTLKDESQVSRVEKYSPILFRARQDAG